MTREEAIKELTDLLPEEFLSEYADAIKMGIEALEQEPCGDAVSRQAVDDAIYDYSRSCDVNYAQIMEFIDKLPSVTPQQEMGYCDWIPVSERLPEEGVSVLVYAERNAYGDNGKYRKKVIDIGWQVDGHWHIDGCNGVGGIAWMQLPPPYQSEITTGAEGSEE